MTEDCVIWLTDINNGHVVLWDSRDVETDEFGYSENEKSSKNILHQARHGTFLLKRTRSDTVSQCEQKHYFYSQLSEHVAQICHSENAKFCRTTSPYTRCQQHFVSFQDSRVDTLLTSWNYSINMFCTFAWYFPPDLSSYYFITDLLFTLTSASDLFPYARK
jgi:hypothetical protein